MELGDEIEIDASDLDEDLEDSLGVSLDAGETGVEQAGADPTADADLPVLVDFADPDASGEFEEAPGPGDTTPQLMPGDAADAAMDTGSIELDALDEAPPEPLALDADEALSLHEAEAGQTAGGASASLSLTAQVNDDLEEAEFYHQQGLHEEARAIYERVLEVAPNHPLALVRIGELAEASSDADAAQGAELPATPEAGFEDESLTAVEPEPTVDPEPEPEFEMQPDPVAEPDAGLEPGDALEPQEAAEPEAAGDELFVAEVGDTPLGNAPVSDATAAELSIEPEAEPAGASFDLAAELSDFFDADGDSESAASSSSPLGSGAEQDAFSAVFSEFKKGVSEQLDEGDHETRYDLGIAYREMGLLEDAVAEFELASQGGTRRLECLHLLGLCTLDLGRGAAAVTHLEAALDAVDPTADEATALRFDLGRAFESLGRIDEARTAWEAVCGGRSLVRRGRGATRQRSLQAKPEVIASRPR